MTHFRPYRNGDTPALAGLWNRGPFGSAAARPLSAHEFDTRVVGGPVFDRAGLIVAERDGSLIGFVHAGFGPETDAAPPLRLSCALGSVGMLVVESGDGSDAIEDHLLAEAERYLRERGARVVYAGGRYPLNPFYWGIYGGSEWSGILGEHAGFHRAVVRAGYQPAGTCVLLDADLSAPEPRDPRAVLLRRQTQVDVTDDALPTTWIHALAVGDFRPTLYRLTSRAEGLELARATTWDMAWFGRRDGRARVGLIDVGVHPDHRRKGYGRFLVSEILRAARKQGTAVASVETDSENTPALGLYQSVGFYPVETATLYRLPPRTS